MVISTALARKFKTPHCFWFILSSIFCKAESVIHVRIVLTTARPNRPKPAAIPTAAVIQYSSRRRETFDLSFFVQFENGAGPDKSDPRDDALNHARYSVRLHSAFQRSEHEQGGAHSYPVHAFLTLPACRTVLAERQRERPESSRSTVGKRGLPSVGHQAIPRLFLPKLYSSLINLTHDFRSILHSIRPHS